MSDPVVPAQMPNPATAGVPQEPPLVREDPVSSPGIPTIPVPVDPIIPQPVPAAPLATQNQQSTDKTLRDDPEDVSQPIEPAPLQIAEELSTPSTEPTLEPATDAVSGDELNPGSDQISQDAVITESLPEPLPDENEQSTDKTPKDDPGGEKSPLELLEEILASADAEKAKIDDEQKKEEDAKAAAVAEAQRVAAEYEEKAKQDMVNVTSELATATQEVQNVEEQLAAQQDKAEDSALPDDQKILQLEHKRE